MNRIVRAGGAVVLLVALVVGVPLVLVVTAGWPLPSKLPDVGNMITMARQNNIQADFVVKTIALVVWLAWIQVMLAVVWEVTVNVPRVLRGRRQRRAPLVITPVSNGVAKLFSLILTAGLLSTVVSQPAIALTNSQFDLSPRTSSLSLETPHVAATPVAAVAPEVSIASVWVTQGDDSLWDIAEQAIGDGSEVSLILQMNPDLDASQALADGTRVRLPAGSSVPSSRTEHAPDSLPATDRQAPAAVATDTAAKQYTVQANDGMWNVAEALLGDGSRHAELHDMLVGQQVAPGVVFTADTFVIHEGWVFTLSDATTAAASAVVDTPENVETHTVVVGDTLSEIAEQRLGDADAWPEIFDDNAGRQMEDGRTFDDPDLILPGWQIDISTAGPDNADEAPSASGDEVSTPEPEVLVDDDDPTSLPESALDPDRTGADATDPADDVVVPARPENTTPPTTEAATAATAVPSTLAATTTTTTTTTTPAGPGSGDSVGDKRPDQPSDSPSPIRIEHAALLAAGILALVGVRRRQRLRGAAPRARVPEPPADVVATERRLRTVDAGERSLRVDVAIRAAAHELVDTDAQIGAVLVDQDGCIDMRLSAGADLTGPWMAVDDDRQWWRLPAATPIELLGESARRVGTPCVALVQLGVADGSDVLVDVEACGTLAVVAPGGHAVEVVTALAAGLATSPYAEIAHLITVSVAEAAVVGHRNAHTAAAPDQALELAASLVGSAATSDRSTFSLRSLRTGGEMWEPAIVLVGETDGRTLTVPSNLPDPGRGVGLIASARHDELTAARTRLVGDADGWRFVGFGTTIDIVPVGMDASELAAVSDLVDDASAPLVLTDELTWDGDLRVVDAVDGEPSSDVSAQHVDEAITETSDSDEADLDDADAVVVPTLESDHSAQAFEPRPHRIMVRLMGGVDVVSHDDRPGTFERSKTVELIAWLATHRSSSTRSAARTALWELDVRDATFANVVSEARRALARLVTPPGDDEWVGRTLTERLPLHDGVVTDADLIEERLTAARLQPPAQAIETLTPAAELIRNIPFAGTSYLWPDAEGITSNLVLLATGVSTELAGHALSVGDIDLVFWATGQGLKVLPGHEELIGLRMQAHARAGDLAGVRQEWESYERVIVADAWSDGEPAPKLLALRHELLTSPA